VKHFSQSLQELTAGKYHAFPPPFTIIGFLYLEAFQTHTLLEFDMTFPQRLKETFLSYVSGKMEKKKHTHTGEKAGYLCSIC
jgi:hypothetical protein